MTSSQVWDVATSSVSGAGAGAGAADDADGLWQLRLYVAGQSPRSLRALSNLTHLCEEHLTGRYEIEVIDLVSHPALASADNVLAIPTLVRRMPAPSRKIIGDLSDTERVLVGLRIRPKVHQ